MGPILALGVYLLGIFMIWDDHRGRDPALAMGDEAPASSAAFFQQVLTTPGGWALILIGIPVGACFAAVVLAISVVSFPLLVDRNIGLPQAVATSIELTQEEPGHRGDMGRDRRGAAGTGIDPAVSGPDRGDAGSGARHWHLYRRAVAPAR